MRRAPFRDARARLLEELARRSLSRGHEPDLPPARGLEAHRALIAELVRPPSAPVPPTRLERLQDWACARLGRPAGASAQGPDEDRVAALVDAAVRAQARLASETRVEAEAAVASLVAHLARAVELEWSADVRRWTAAVEETLRYVVFDSEVPSRRAQEAWQRLWAHRARSADPRLAVTMARALVAEEREGHDAWAYWNATFDLRAG